MHKNNHIISKINQISILFLFFTLTSCSSGVVTSVPSNQVVVILDGSGSYYHRQQEALTKVISLLDSMTQTKLHRWETGTDQITIIGLDAMPDVLWEGSLQMLKSMDSKEFASRFQSRSDLSSCTDVKAAFQLATLKLGGDPRYTSKYLLIFSDLIHEPPTTSVGVCQRATGSPPEDFPWEALRDVSVSAFWVPPNQKLLWRRAADQHGLASNFQIYTSSESSKVKIAPPPRPTLKITEQDRKIQRDQLTRSATGIGKWILFVVALILLFPLMMITINRLRQRRGQQVITHTPRIVRPIPVPRYRPVNPLPPGSLRPPRPFPNAANPNQRQQ